MVNKEKLLEEKRDLLKERENLVTDSNLPNEQVIRYSINKRLIKISKLLGRR
jgi:hypothetical protein